MRHIENALSSPTNPITTAHELVNILNGYLPDATSESKPLSTEKLRELVSVAEVNLHNVTAQSSIMAAINNIGAEIRHHFAEMNRRMELIESKRLNSLPNDSQTTPSQKSIAAVPTAPEISHNLETVELVITVLNQLSAERSRLEREKEEAREEAYRKACSWFLFRREEGVVRETQEATERAAEERKAREEEERKARKEQDRLRLQREKEEEEVRERLRLQKEEEERAALEVQEAAERAAREEEERRRVEAEAEAELAREAEVAAKAEAERQAAERKAQAEASARLAQKVLRSEAESISSTPSPPPSLPSKPIIGLSSKRPTPGHLDLSQATIRDASVSALASARIIQDIESFSYPEGIKSPGPALELNVDADKGKFRYDRQFLLQVCKERPDASPILNALGIDKSQSKAEEASRRPTKARGTGPMPPSESTGGFAFSGSGKSGMNMNGVLGGFAGTLAKGSQERITQSTSGCSVSTDVPPFPARKNMSMVRTPSQGGVGSTGPQSPKEAPRHSRNEYGGDEIQALVDDASRLSNPSTPLIPLEHVVPLARSEKRWQGRRIQIVERKVKALLNELTMERFESISDQIIQWANKSENESDGQSLILVTRLVFEKATDEATRSEMYAKLCRKMQEQISEDIQDDNVKDSEGIPIKGGALFRKYLLNRCQEDFERGWSTKESAAAKADADRAVEEAFDIREQMSDGEVALSDEYYAAEKARRQGLGTVKFIGELFKLQMLTARIMHECIKKFLSNVDDPEEEEIESLCQLLTTVGRLLDTPTAKKHMDIYFSRMEELTRHSSINARIRFMLMDVLDLREQKWRTRRVVAQSSTIVQVHADTVEDRESVQWTQMGGSMFRGGSQRGRERFEITSDGWSVAGNNAAPRPPPIHFGLISDADATLSSSPTAKPSRRKVDVNSFFRSAPTPGNPWSPAPIPPSVPYSPPARPHDPAFSYPYYSYGEPVGWPYPVPPPRGNQLPPPTPALHQKTSTPETPTLGRGRERSQFTSDGWSVAGNNATPRPPPKEAGDLSKFGTFSKAPPPPTFGPSRAFSKKEVKGGETPVPRQTSSANMFSALNSDWATEVPQTSSSSRAPSHTPSVDLGAGGLPEPPVRKKLNLQPRTVPQESEETSVEGQGAQDKSDEVPTGRASPVGMTEAQADARIEEDVKEFWVLRNVGEVQHYFEALPVVHRSRLVLKLASTALEKREVDVVLTAELFSKVSDAGLCSGEVFEAGLASTVEMVDELSIDIPKAYSFVARLLKGSKLSRSSIESLTSKIMVDGDPLVLPSEKLIKEYEKLE